MDEDIKLQIVIFLNLKLCLVKINVEKRSKCGTCQRDNSKKPYMGISLTKIVAYNWKSVLYIIIIFVINITFPEDDIK